MRRLALSLLTALAVACSLITPAHADPVPPEVTGYRLSLTSSATGAVTAGARVTFTGKLEGSTPDGWIPLPGQQVDVTNEFADALGSATTDAAGAYTVTATIGRDMAVHAAAPIGQAVSDP